MDKEDSYQNLINIYAGILWNYQKFVGEIKRIHYYFDCPQYQELINKYHIDEIAKEGGSFEKAKRLLHYLSPRLSHEPQFLNDIPCNALSLLEYSFNNEEHGINCLNKSKILEECCLALGIYARRVSMMPYSPYDLDNHVVCEIYDEQLNKWIMLDPSSDGYVIDDQKIPLSLLEMREKCLQNEFMTFVLSNQKLTDLQKLKHQHLEINAYYCKNLFYFLVDDVCQFGEPHQKYVIAPQGYHVLDNRIKNLEYRIQLFDNHQDIVSLFQKKLEELKGQHEPFKVSLETLKDFPRI